MSKSHEIRSYDYVNHSYEKVCNALQDQANAVFRAATTSAESRAKAVAAGLHVKVAGIDIGKQILINVTDQEDVDKRGKRRTEISLEWEASDAPGLFPVMNAKLSIYPITATETQLDFQGRYNPPLGVVGKALDVIVGRRIAEASAHQFIAEVAAYLRNELD